MVIIKDSSQITPLLATLLLLLSSEQGKFKMNTTKKTRNYTWPIFFRAIELA